MSDVLFALTGDVRRNSRALRQLRTLDDMGCSVRVLSLADTPGDDTIGSDIRVTFLKHPSGRGPVFFWRVHRTFSRAVRPVSARVYHASDLYALPAMTRAATTRDGALIFDSRELYPHVASTAGRPWVRWFWKAVESTCIRRCDEVFTVNESIAHELQDTYDLSPTVLYNAPAYREVDASNYIRHHTGISDETTIVLHQGSMQHDRGCEQLVRAIGDVSGAALVFLGGGPLRDELKTLAHRLGLSDRVYFLPPVAPDELLPVTASADIGVSLLQDTCLNHRLALPNKLFEYLIAGLPVVASDLPEIGKVLRDQAVGKLVPPDDIQALSRQLQELVSHPELRLEMTRNAPRVFETYGWGSSARRFCRAYGKVLGTREPTRPPAGSG